MEVFFHFLAYLALVLEILSKAPVVVTVLTSLLISLKVIVPRRAFFRTTGLTSMLNDVLHPPLFCLIFDIKRMMAVGTNIICLLYTSDAADE